MSTPLAARPKSPSLKDQILNRYTNLCILIGQKSHDKSLLEVDIERLMSEATVLKNQYLSAEMVEKEAAKMAADEKAKVKEDTENGKSELSNPASH